MAEPVFGAEYSAAYDSLYFDKDYAAECRLIADVLQRYGEGETHAIADFGCGTGAHSIRLATLGHDVVGVDLSESMLRVARAKTPAAGSFAPNAGVQFTQGDIARLDLARRFDAVIMMFAVLSYQTTNERLAATLRNVRRHLRTGGIFIADFWYGPAVLATQPSDRVKIVEQGASQIIRTAQTLLDSLRHVADVTFNVWKIDGDRVTSRIRETHRMRYFFPEEIAFHLQHAALEGLTLRAFADLDRPVDDSTWNAIFVARAI